jgi:lantibiotic modifying enzyme
MWGTPGTLLAARSMLDATGDQRWADLWRTTAESLWTQREPDGLWTQQLDGRSFRALGPVHGLVGNVRVLLQGEELLDERRRSQLVAETSAILERDAVVEDGLANWPAVADPARVELRLQWCHGAPGILAAAADLLNEELVIAGAELTWQAGPPTMEKGSSICHGTAGNGYAFLKALAWTGDERWLERARRFAVHALEQIERRGHGRYSLWTGDLGVALFAADCLEERTAYPIVDGWE